MSLVKKLEREVSRQGSPGMTVRQKEYLKMTKSRAKKALNMILEGSSEQRAFEFFQNGR